LLKERSFESTPLSSFLDSLCNSNKVVEPRQVITLKKISHSYRPIETPEMTSRPDSNYYVGVRERISTVTTTHRTTTSLPTLPQPRHQYFSIFLSWLDNSYARAETFIKLESHNWACVSVCQQESRKRNCSIMV